jgi:Virus neck protein
MPTSQYFNNYNSQYTEQRLVEDLIVESIKIMGFDGMYLTNDNDQARDLLYGEDPVKKFTSAFPVEMYLSEALNFTGDKEFFSKFGLEIKNHTKVLVTRRSFNQRVPQNKFTRPREGDLIWIPFLNGTGELYEITFTDQDKDFYMLGRPAPYFYELHLEKFKFSSELLATGVADIDDAATQATYSIQLSLGAGTGDYQRGEIVYQSSANTQANATAVAIVQSFVASKNTATANTLVVSNIAGEFAEGSPFKVVGATSNAQYVLSSYNPLSDNVEDDTYDNYVIETSANSIVNFSETNPFGSI